jgi:serine/threonine protein phosphatase PrpC
MTYHGTYAYKTDIGRVRSHNEDQAMVVLNASGEVFLIVCDGMGGANKGDVASKTRHRFALGELPQKETFPSLSSTSGGSPKLAKRPTP